MHFIQWEHFVEKFFIKITQNFSQLNEHKNKQHLTEKIYLPKNKGLFLGIKYIIDKIHKKKTGKSK